jgi:PAS domain S-box-containing protein
MIRRTAAKQMRLFRNLSIRGKLLVVIMVAALFTMMITGVTLSVYQYYLFQGWLVQNMEYQADITGSNSISALMFRDRKDASKVVGALMKVDVLTGAALYLPNGEKFAGWVCAGCREMPETIPDWQGLREFDDHFMLVRKIMLGDMQAGSIVIRSTKKERELFLQKSILAIGILLCPVTLITLFLSTWLRKIISGPVESLAAVTREISRKQDYSIRALRQGNDEIGMLTDFFNVMLDQIEKSDRELRRQDILLRSIINNTSALILLKDLEGEYIMANRRFLELFELDEQELYGKSDASIFPQGLASLFHDRDMEVVRYGIALEGEETLPVGDKVFTYITSRFPLHDSSGQIYAVCTIFTDITERKDYEVKLKEMGIYLSSVFNSMPSAMIGLDESGAVTRLNSKAEELLETTMDMARDKRFVDIIPMFSEYAEDFERAVAIDDVGKISMTTGMAEGRERYYEATVYPLKSGGISGAVIRIDEVTEHVHMQEMMIQTEKMMSVAGLAAGMAHEINNPLGIILQAVQNIRRRIDPDLAVNMKFAEQAGLDLDALAEYFEQRMIPVMLDDVQQAGERAADIVANMLQFSRHTESRWQEADPVDIVEQAIELAGKDYDLKKKFDFRHIKIIKEFDSNIPKVRVSITEIEQVLLNLLKNAAQALAEKDIADPLITLRMINEGHSLKIEVEDNGPGIPQDIQKKIFEPFFSTKPPGTGTGLGLAVAYMIITQNHRGQMMVRSIHGKGTCFTIILPFEYGDKI